MRAALFRIVLSLAATAVTVGTNLKRFGKAGYQIVWTGTPTGAFTVEASNDSTNGTDGTWTEVTMAIGSAPSGGAGSVLIDLSSSPWEWVRLRYTRSAGTGSATATLFAKAPV